MIYTSNFANLKNIPEDMVPISISLYTPKWFKGKRYPKLAPTEKLLRKWKKDNDEYSYEVIYIFDVLSWLNVEEVEKELYKLSGSRDVVLLCYESSDKFCHRHLVAKWFRSKKISCEEFTKTVRDKRSRLRKDERDGSKKANIQNSKRTRTSIWDEKQLGG